MWFGIYLRRADKIRDISKAEHHHFHTISLAPSREVDSNRAESSGFGVRPGLNDTLEEVRVTDGLILEAIGQLIMSCTTSRHSATGARTHIRESRAQIRRCRQRPAVCRTISQLERHTVLHASTAVQILDAAVFVEL